jgi:hypothetical protein
MHSIHSITPHHETKHRKSQASLNAFRTALLNCGVAGICAIMWAQMPVDRWGNGCNCLVFEEPTHSQAHHSATTDTGAFADRQMVMLREWRNCWECNDMHFRPGTVNQTMNPRELPMG